MAQRQEEAMCQAALQKEEEHILRLKHETDLEAAAVEQREKEAARLARLCKPVSPPDPHSAWKRVKWSSLPESPARPASPTPSGVSSRNNAPPPGGVFLIDGENDEEYY
jgi:hypothetical protein